jgi:hypothetical protein
MKERTGFIFLKRFDDSIKDLDFEDRCVMYEAIINYALYFEEPLLSKGYLISIWKLISGQIDQVQKKYDASVNNGSLGGRPKKPKNNPTETQDKPNNNLNETCEEPLKVKVKVKEKEKANIKANANIKEKLNANAAYDDYMKSLGIDLNNEKDIDDLTKLGLNVEDYI